MLKKLLSLTLTLGLIQLLPIVTFSSVVSFILTVLVLAVLMYLIEPVLRVFSIPLSVATFGLFKIVLLLGSVWLTTFLVPGFIIYPMIFFGIKIHYFYTLIFVSTLIRGLDSLIRILVRS